MSLGRTWIVATSLVIAACAAHETEPSETVGSPATGAHEQKEKGTGTGKGTAGASPETDAGMPAPSFGDVYAVFAMSCGGGKSGCHVTGSAASLEMHDARSAYDHLVGVASGKCAGEKRVVGGDADASVLVQALEGSASCVKQMPLGRDPLSASELAMIRAWIDAGATYD